MELDNVGIDIGKTVFHEQRRGDGGQEEVLALSAAAFHGQPAGAVDRDGSLRRRSLPWSRLA